MLHFELKQFKLKSAQNKIGLLAIFRSFLAVESQEEAEGPSSMPRPSFSLFLRRRQRPPNYNQDFRKRQSKRGPKVI